MFFIGIRWTVWTGFFWLMVRGHRQPLVNMLKDLRIPQIGRNIPLRWPVCLPRTLPHVFEHGKNILSVTIVWWWHIEAMEGEPTASLILVPIVTLHRQLLPHILIFLRSFWKTGLQAFMYIWSMKNTFFLPKGKVTESSDIKQFIKILTYTEFFRKSAENYLIFRGTCGSWKLLIYIAGSAH